MDMDNKMKTNLSCGTYTVCDSASLSSAFRGEMTEQFRIVFDLIRKGAVTCEEAWKLLLDIVPGKTEYIPYAAPAYPAYPVCPVYIQDPGTNSVPYSPDYFKIWCTSSSHGQCGTSCGEPAGDCPENGI